MSRRARVVTLVLLAVTCLAPRHAAGCLWLYGTDAQGERIMMDGLGPAAYVDELRSHRTLPGVWERRRASFESLPAEQQDYKARSNYAVALLHLGAVDEAIATLEAVEAMRPGEYIVASNLGTAYEMAGRVDEAAQWIAEGMARNADAHWGSEWVHAAVLETKMRLAEDPARLETRGALGLDFGGDLTPARPTDAALVGVGAPTDLAGLARDLEYQLTERLALVPPPDAIVGSLLSDLACVLALERSLEHAIPVLGLAADYGAPRPELVAARREHFATLVAANPDSLARANPDLGMGLGPTILGVVALVIAVILVRRAIRKRRAT